MALLAARFPHLKAYLASDARSPGALNFEQLLGFLYAVSSAPDIVDASEWLRFVFREHASDGAESQAARLAVLEALDLHHAINCEVLADDAKLPADCTPRTDVLTNLDPECGLSRWAQGFSVGHDWLEQTW
jgi:yecA family protein